MKHSLIISLFCLGLAGLLLANTGCKTVDTNGNTTTVIDTNQVVSGIRLATSIGVQAAIVNDTNVVQYVHLAESVIDAAINSSTFDPTNLIANIDAIALPNGTADVADKQAALGIKAGIQAYQLFLGQQAGKQLQATSPLLVLCLQALILGIEDAIAATQPPAVVTPPVPVTTTNP